MNPDCDFENGRPVESIQFDHASLDSAEDIMREKLDQGLSALKIVEEYNSKAKLEKIESVGRQAEDLALDFIRKFLAMIVADEKPMLFIDQHLWLSGLAAKNFLTLPVLAKRHGVSKQAFLQGAERLNEVFKYPPTEAQRKDDARDTMRSRQIPRNPERLHEQLS